MSALAEADAPAVEVRDLRVELSASGVDVVDEIQIEIRAGEVLVLVRREGRLHGVDEQPIEVRPADVLEQRLRGGRQLACRPAIARDSR